MSKLLDFMKANSRRQNLEEGWTKVEICQ